MQSDACVEVDSNFYSVPWKWIKSQVLVQVMDQEIKIFNDAEELASHPICIGRRQRSIHPGHLTGIIGVGGTGKEKQKTSTMTPRKIERAELLRPLTEYEAVVGGGW